MLAIWWNKNYFFDSGLNSDFRKKEFFLNSFYDVLWSLMWERSGISISSMLAHVPDVPFIDDSTKKSNKELNADFEILGMNCKILQLLFWSQNPIAKCFFV